MLNFRKPYFSVRKLYIWWLNYFKFGFGFTLIHDNRDYDNRGKSNHVISRLCIDAMLMSCIKIKMMMMTNDE